MSTGGFLALPTLAEILLDARVYSVPLTHAFRGLTSREGMLIHGPSGWGEFAPFDDYSDVAAARWLSAAVEAAWGTWPQPRRTEVAVNAIVPAVSADEATQLVVDSDCSTVKVKVAQSGQTLSDDIARVGSVRDALGPDGRIRIDANGGWTVSSAQRAIFELATVGLEYVEQPCSSLAEMQQLRRLVDVPLAVDEAIRTAPTPTKVSGVHEAADVIIVKAAPLGGVHAALEVVEQYGLPAVVSSALESSVGLSAGLTLAGAMPELPFACGLGTGRLLRIDVVADPLVPSAGVLTLRRPPVDEAAVAACSVSPLNSEKWRRRLTQAYAALPVVAVP